ncbi:MAG: hypothetical protein F4W90_08285 [Gammaproteobacteria bacterium]|nr:hypothetical protein [Gammaproteobacteria bacterium]
MKLVNDPLLFIREQARAMFPSGKASGSVLMSNIAFGAAALGAGHVEICNKDNWWFAASETNWLTKGLPDDTQPKELFHSPLKFSTLGPNSYRPELYVGLFAEDIYLDLAGQCIKIQGNVPHPQPHIDTVPPWCVYVLACSVGNSA